MSMPFVVTQEYPIYRDSEGAIAFTIKNTSEDNLLIKILTAQTMQKSIKINHAIFAVKAKQMCRIFGTYTPPCTDLQP